MMIALVALGLGAVAVLADASSLVAAEVIPAGDGVTVANAELRDGDGPEVYDLYAGREVRRTVYAGQPITFENTRSARLVTRNQVVTIKFISGPLEISTSGRAMGDAALNETVSVLNLQSRQMVQGVVKADGWVLVQ
ncbi:flagellar basal body P-ring formation chaperone FlgA [Hyphomonas sp.]|jgi:flagella basal body P-ring formation protein FlgA|uniref:flagellar basal body P-ring formation chaperone FlgA n=1 Tax=Hyphomonas sp. TaxID=87 RepID=UPI0037BE7B06